MFVSVADIYSRTAVEKDGLESLIESGFLDGLAVSGSREELLAAARDLPKKRNSSRQAELPLPHPASWWEQRLGLGDRTSYLPPTAARREEMEWEALSLNVFRHPLSPYREALKELRVTPSREILDLPHGTKVRAAGLLESLQRPPTKSGRPVYFLMIEDERGLLQATIFERVYARYGHLLHREGAFLLEGVVEQDIRRGLSFLVHRVEGLGEILASGEVPAPRAASSSGAFLRAGRRSRRAG